MHRRIPIPVTSSDNRTSSPGLTILCLLATASVCSHASAANSTIYRCDDHGKTLFQDSPCGTQPGLAAPAGRAIPSSTATPLSSPLSPPSSAPNAQQNPMGDWRGQAQFQGTENGQHLDGSQSVVPLVISLAPEGKVTGLSPENGCRALGIWSPGFPSGPDPRVATLDITLSGCRFSGFNRRYSGTLIVAAKERSAQIGLQAYDMRPGQPTRLYDVKATLRP